MMQFISASSSSPEISSPTCMLQELGEKVPVLAEGKAEKKLATILG